MTEALYREAYGIALSENTRAAWLLNLATELSRPARGWRRWLPAWIWLRRRDLRLASIGVFDAADYLSRHRDVADRRFNPVYHYLAHGWAEGRDGGVSFTVRPAIKPDLTAIPAILASGLFDPKWYASHYGVDGTDEEIVEDYLTVSAHDTLREPGPLFSGAFYGFTHPDTRAVNPLVHYVRQGMREGRKAFQPNAVDAFTCLAPRYSIRTLVDFLEADRPVLVLYGQDGSCFSTSVARYVAETLGVAGFAVDLADNHDGFDLDRYEIVVVAPHEYCVDGPGSGLLPDVAARVVYVNLASWDTGAFSFSPKRILTSRKVVDINPVSACGLARLGIEAGFLPLQSRALGVFDFGRFPSKQSVVSGRPGQAAGDPSDALQGCADAGSARHPDSESDIDAILASGLFDAGWYGAHYGVTGTDRELVEDYLATSSRDTSRQPGPLFSGTFYRLEYADTQDMNPLVHYIRSGMREGRVSFQADAADRFMGAVSGEPVYGIRDFLKPGRAIAVLYWRDGKLFSAEIARYMAEMLVHAGFDVELLADHLDLDLERMSVVVIAPHEYCVYGPGAGFSADVAARAVHVNLEPWHTSSFSQALAAILKSRKVLDINPMSARGFARLGVRAGFLPLHPRAGGVFDLGSRRADAARDSASDRSDLAVRGGEASQNSPEIEINLGDIPALLGSGLFDAKWYAGQYGVAGTDHQLVEDFLRTSAQDPLRDPGPLFSSAFYRLRHPDTRIVNPLVHYVFHGMREGRAAFQSAVADAFMTSANAEVIHTFRDFLQPGRPIVVLHWRDGNFFFTDIAQYVAEILASAGFDVQLRDDHAEIDLDSTEIVVVAPHEYCVHGPGAQFSPEVVARVLHVNLEQWHTPWFSLALDKMLKSRKALDINPVSAGGLSRLGIKAGFLPLLPRPGGVFDFGQCPPSAQLSGLRAIKPLTYPKEVLKRPYDILFVGYLNKHRAESLAELGHVLADYECFLHAPRFTGPITPDSPNMIGSRDLAQIAQNTKLLLNIHQGESHYFEWHRLVVSGIAQGCVPLTEPCAHIGIVQPGVHYVEATLEEMPDRIAWLLNTDAGRREIARIHLNGRALMARLHKEMMGYLS